MATPATTVLTITRQMGSGGSYIGQAVARRLGFKYVDKEILEEAARMLGAEEAASLEPLEERVASLWSRLTRHLSLGPPDALFTPPQLHSSVYEEDLFRVERQVIRELSARDNCVIIGRAAPFVLRDHPGVVRLFVHAPEAWRLDQLEKTLGPRDRHELRELVRRSDADRMRFVQAVCGCHWSDACHYDLTVNPATLGLDAACDLVTQIVQARMQARTR